MFRKETSLGGFFEQEARSIVVLFVLQCLTVESLFDPPPPLFDLFKLLHALLTWSVTYSACNAI